MLWVASACYLQTQALLVLLVVRLLVLWAESASGGLQQTCLMEAAQEVRAALRQILQVVV